MARKAYVSCSVSGKGKDRRLVFNLCANGETHYLFNQTFHDSVYDYYRNGVSVEQAIDYSRAVDNAAMQRVMDKLPSHLRYLESEYGVVALQKAKGKAYRQANKKFKEAYV